jgi:ABC-type Fe3+-hydroxamate transport system substrate-binding protein
MEVVDSLGRAVECAGRPSRVVSLVPSETDTLCQLGLFSSLVGRTVFCEEPRGRVEAVATCGGTKNVDVRAVAQLQPDLVLANQEENTRTDVEALILLGLRVHVSFPRSLEDSLAYLCTLCLLASIEPEAHPLVAEATAALREVHARRFASYARVFVPIWRDPWMTFSAQTYASSMLTACGARNVFDDRLRRYPLAADLGLRGAHELQVDSDRDVRYPRVTLEEVRSRCPQAALLPDEPYAFTNADAVEVAQAVRELSGFKARLVSGKDLLWYGARMSRGLQRLTAVIAAVQGVD